MICRQVVISGKVQGVFFRSSMKAIADELKVVGWVRNREDGSVEALLQGDESSVDKVIDWSKRGPDRARVDSVDHFELPCKDHYRNFSILY